MSRRARTANEQRKHSGRAFYEKRRTELRLRGLLRGLEKEQQQEAAAMEGRRAIGAEMDPETYKKAVRRLSAGYTPPLFQDSTSREQQEAAQGQ